MRPLYILVLTTFLPFASHAQQAAAPVAVAPAAGAQPGAGPAVAETATPETATAETATPATPALVVAAADVVLDDFMFRRRPVVVFADSPDDPAFIRQMLLLDRDPAALLERHVVVITDTDPAARSEVRLRLRPRGFSLVMLDKDLRPVLRKPLPWDVREIVAAIDKFPLRRQEMLEQRPAGR